jgi:hypothetical protein
VISRQAYAPPLSSCPARLLLLVLLAGAPARAAGEFTVVDTGQDGCYDDAAQIACPSPGQPFHGQDAQYEGAQPAYVDNGDGTVTDTNTELMWQQTPASVKSTFTEAVAAAPAFGLAGHDDWRLPTIKELYSLVDFRGVTGNSAATGVAYIDTSYFDFEYGDEGAGERHIDAQYWSSTEYVSTTMNGDATAFGVNFADGRIKGYPAEPVGPPGDEFEMTAFVRHVRGPAYGANDFSDNGDGTVTDAATGLMWQQADSGLGMDWGQALALCEGLTLAGHDDWRLPNVKELQGIVDYTRSPDTTSSAAIDPIFQASPIVDEGGATNYPFYWAGTTHLDGPLDSLGGWGVYVCFGEALGFMEMPPGSGSYRLVDVHGAGAQRSDPKSGDPADWPLGNGPQGDVVRIENHVRCVRTASAAPADSDGDTVDDDADCLPDDADAWHPPSEASLLMLEGRGSTTLSWGPPLDPGTAVPVVYDVLRTRLASRFSSAICLEADETDETAADPDLPGAGDCFYYLVGAENGCGPDGRDLGADHAGTPRSAPDCT